MQENTKSADLLFPLTLVFCAFKMMAGYAGVMDLIFCDDNAYIKGGLEILRGVYPDAQSGPLYSLWYAGLAFFTQDPVGLFYGNYMLLSTMVPLLIYGLCRRAGVAPLTALLAGFLFLISFGNLQAYPKVGHLCILLVLGALLAASFLRSRFRYLVACLLASFACAYVRPEYYVGFLALLAFAMGVFFQRLLRGEKHSMAFLCGGILLTGLLAAVVQLKVGCPLVGGRGFAAFEQHFAWNYSKVFPGHEGAMFHYEPVIQRFFPGAGSLSQAFFVNPAAFSAHLLFNLVRVPIKFIYLLVVHYPMFLPLRWQGAVWGEGALFAGLLLLAGWKFRVDLLARAGELREAMRVDPVSAGAMLLILVPSLLSGICVAPKDYYLGLPAVFLLLLLACAFQPAIERLLPARRDALSILLPLFCLAATPYLGLPWFSGPLPLPHKEVVRALQSLQLRPGTSREPALVLENVGGYTAYLGPGFERVPGCGERGFARLLETARPVAVVVSAELRGDPACVNDADFARFLSEPGAFGFEQGARASDVLIFRRE